MSNPAQLTSRADTEGFTNPFYEPYTEKERERETEREREIQLYTYICRRIYIYIYKEAKKNEDEEMDKSLLELELTEELKACRFSMLYTICYHGSRSGPTPAITGAQKYAP